MRILVTTANCQTAFFGQTPGRRSIWGACEFVPDSIPGYDYSGPWDAWVVICDLPVRAQTILCSPGNTLFLNNEPPAVKRYPSRFLAQFDKVITVDHNPGHAGACIGQMALAWHAGLTFGDKLACRLDYDQLKTMTTWHKPKLLSVICARKFTTEGHRARNPFLKRLKTHFGNDFDVFGNGFRPIDGKWDAIAPYRYHVVLENCCYEHYWTEKLSDAYLGAAYPFYYGCPNLDSYFHDEAYTRIDIMNPSAAIVIIENAIRQDFWQQRRPAVLKARELVLDRYNLFPVLAAHCQAFEKRPYRSITLRSEKSFVSPARRGLRFIRKLMGKLT